MATDNSARGRRGDRDFKLLKQKIQATVPVLPYPPRLPARHEPTWLETVNSKTEEFWSISDIPLLRIYCRVVEEIEILTNEIEEEGNVIENARGNPVINPKIMVRMISENRLMALCTKLRMQPQARANTADTAAKAKQRGEASATAAFIDADEDDLLSGAEGGLLQ